LLLAKIENQQFTDPENTDMSELAESKLKDFEDIISHRNIEVDLQCDEKLIINMSPALAEILIVNLVNNAIRHNYQNGKLSIKTGAHFLEVSNTGNVLKADPKSLFNRFKKESASGESIGLGLAIVKQICDNYGLEIKYQNQDSLHTIRISS